MAIKPQRRHQRQFGRDLVVITLSVAIAVVLVKGELIPALMSTIGFVPIEAFIAGFFFTSLLTLIPAGAALIEMGQFVPPGQLALWGALGSVVGDLLLFLVVRDVISDDVLSLLRGPWVRKIKALFRSPYLSWSVPVAGALAIASPLPDEVGIAILGLSKSDVRFLIPVSYAMNYIGIYILGYLAFGG